MQASMQSGHTRTNKKGAWAMVTWWYSEGSFRVGPVDFDCIRRLLLDYKLGEKTLVWHKGMEEWLPVTAVPELSCFVPPAGSAPPKKKLPEAFVSPIKPFTASELVGSDLWQKLINTVTALTLVSLTLFVAATTVKAVIANRAGQLASASTGVSAQMWQNPITRRNAHLDPIWQARSSVSLGQRDYLFADSAQRTLLKLTMEETQGLTLEKFVSLLRQKTAREIALTDGGRFGLRNGARIWQAEGHLASQPELLLQIQLMQIGSAYWQIITLHRAADAAAIEMLDTLRSELWTTVSDSGITQP